MLLQEEQHIIRWLTQYGALAKTQVIRLLKDQPPAKAELRCAHFYCSAMGDQDMTEVYVIPKELFPRWLEAEKMNDLKEEKLYETRPIQL